MRLRLVPMITAVIFIVFAAPVVGQPQQIKAVMVEQSPVLDGKLDDACWQRAADAVDFLYLETGAQASEKTEAWICYDSTNIYVAFRCWDSQPDKITSQQKKRGGAFFTDDWVGIDVDPWHTHTSTYWFYVNSIGTQGEYLPGAGGSKIEWLGDWQAAAKTDDSGWIAEMAIPWSILKYPKNLDCMGISFIRGHARTNMGWVCPNLGPNEDMSLMFDWVGIEPPSPKLAGIALGYTNVGVGGVPFKNGIDFKKQLSQQVNGLLTINPDFDSIEQDVESIDFTYSPRVLSDNRPFFAEGGDSQQDGEYRMFYSRDIEDVDAGLKVAGQTGRQTFSGMMTTGGNDDGHFFYKSKWQFDRANHIGIAATATREPDVENYVTSFYGRLGKDSGERVDRCEYRLMKSWTPGPSGNGAVLVTGAGGYGGPRQIGWGMWYQDVRPDYFASDGIVPQSDLKGWDYYLGYHDEYDKGWIRGWGLSLNGADQHFHSGEVLARGLSFSVNVWTLDTQFFFDVGRSAQRDASLADSTLYHDSLYTFGYGWTQTDMYRRGWANLTFGKRAGGRSLQATVKQGFALGDNFHTDLSLEYVKMTGPFARRERQSVASISYDISSERSLSARIVERDGELNLAFGFRQAVRRGQDIYLLFGDPNADRTKNRVILKLISPLF